MAKKNYKGCRTDRTSSYVPCLVARDEPHVSVGGLVDMGKEHKKEFCVQEKEGALCAQHKERKIVKEAKDHRRQNGEVHDEGKVST